MAQWLRALTALAEDTDFVLSTPCQVAHNRNSRGFNTLFLPLHVPWCAHIQAGKTLINIK